MRDSEADFPVYPDMAAALTRAAELIEQADALIVAAGAGMGVDSGLPDFRGNNGFWTAYPALAEAQLDFTRIASPWAFQHHPELAWGFYGHRLQLYRSAQPHMGFEKLRHWGEQKSNGLGVFTSNVDGQFQKVGFPNTSIHECHGSIHYLQCLEPCCDDIWPADGFVPDVDEANCWLINEPPCCPRCGGLARPNILMFGDWGWLSSRADRQAQRLSQWLSRTQRPVVIELGAGTAIPSVRNFSQRAVQRHGGQLIRINPRDWQVKEAHGIGLATQALDGLMALAALLEQRGQPSSGLQAGRVGADAVLRQWAAR